MELPNPFLPGAVSLLEQIDKKLVVVLRDGKTLIGYLRTIDQVCQNSKGLLKIPINLKLS